MFSRSGFGWGRRRSQTGEVVWLKDVEACNYTECSLFFMLALITIYHSSSALFVKSVSAHNTSNPATLTAAVV